MSFDDVCAGCTFLRERAYDNGKHWCSEKGEEHYSTDPKCSLYCEAYSRSNRVKENMYSNSKKHIDDYNDSYCYLTTIVCKVLGFDDNNYYLNILRWFRDNILKNNIKYIPLLITYDFVGPYISLQIANDKNRKEISTFVFNKYIVSSVKYIEENRYEDAINTYIEMTNYLAKRYNISTGYENVDINTIDLITLGHARLLGQK